MRLHVVTWLLFLAAASCKPTLKQEKNKDNADLALLFNNYYEQRIRLFPLEAAANGDYRYNNLLNIDFTDGFRDSIRTFYLGNLEEIKKFERDKLNENDQISYDIFRREMEISLEGLQYQDHFIPFNQFWGLPLTMGQLGGGKGIQPFKTVKDYKDWLARVVRFSSWSDSAIVYFRKGMAAGFVLPVQLVRKMVPQMRAMETADATKSLFYEPVSVMPASFPDSEKTAIQVLFKDAISRQLVPSYRKLANFLEKEYLPKARNSSGISVLPRGKERYEYAIRYWTTTNKTPEQIFNLGLAEVKRIREEMEKTKTLAGFNGSLEAFFELMKNDSKFMPYKSSSNVLDAFRAIQKTIDPNLKKMFGRVPKTPFEVRQTEAFRAASASAEYNPGSPDGSRPGVFYVPIIDAARFNITSGMESLFLHEAIPGHHYQISLQQENDSLPKFRRFSWYGAYGEGWALYCESLGKELGLYTDPYQYMGALGDEIHRAIRLVVDVGLHTRGWTREQAIKYMMENEAISEQGATAEIERYMAIPGQALSYKIGALKIRELRDRYAKSLGDQFRLASFHDAFLRDGCMPLDVVEKKMDNWAGKQQVSRQLSAISFQQINGGKLPPLANRRRLMSESHTQVNVRSRSPQFKS